MPVDEELISEIARAAAQVQRTVDQCHEARDAWVSMHEAKPPGIGQWRVGWAPDCSTLESQLTRLMDYLNRALAGEDLPLGSAPASDIEEKAAQQWASEMQEELRALKRETAALAVYASDMQANMNLIGLALAGVGAVALGAAGASAGSIVGIPVAPLFAGSGAAMEFSALGFWAFGEEFQLLGNRYQEINNELPE